MNKITYVIIIVVLWISSIIFFFTICKFCKITLLRSTFISLITPPDQNLEHAGEHKTRELQISNEV